MLTSDVSLKSHIRSKLALAKDPDSCQRRAGAKWSGSCCLPTAHTHLPSPPALLSAPLPRRELLEPGTEWPLASRSKPPSVPAEPGPTPRRVAHPRPHSCLRCIHPQPLQRRSVSSSSSSSYSRRSRTRSRGEAAGSGGESRQCMERRRRGLAAGSTRCCLLFYGLQ